MFYLDVDLAQKHSEEENPVFYVQYAHARVSRFPKTIFFGKRRNLLVYFRNLSEKPIPAEHPKKFNKAENELVLQIFGFPEVARCFNQKFF
ncbi:MAG: hypothetical protein CM15mP58_07520 [Burkholderiaceae bacterium]|nr:MAG: hypothetical protein CM15mP58_07520 [Burkholderiaceae bacterium]